MNALIVFVKAPAAGRVKTRLCPPLAAADAATLYRAFVEDTLASAAQVPAARLEVAYEPSPEFPDLGWLGAAPPHFAQEGRSLGERLHRAFNRAFSNGAGRTIVIGSDSPQLPADLIARAFARLDDVDLVLGPAEDGGYYLIGLREPQAALFDAIPWSTADVLSETLRGASRERLSLALLNGHYDIDDHADLARLAFELRSGRCRAPKTLETLDRLSIARVETHGSMPAG